MVVFATTVAVVWTAGKMLSRSPVGDSHGLSTSIGEVEDSVDSRVHSAYHHLFLGISNPSVMVVDHSIPGPHW